MNYRTDLHERLSGIERGLADPAHLRPAPFVRLRGLRDRSPSVRTIRLRAARLDIPFAEAVDSNGLPSERLAAMFRPRETPVEMLADHALQGAEAEITPYEAPLEQAS